MITTLRFYNQETQSYIDSIVLLRFPNESILDFQILSTIVVHKMALEATKYSLSTALPRKGGDSFLFSHLWAINWVEKKNN